MTDRTGPGTIAMPKRGALDIAIRAGLADAPRPAGPDVGAGLIEDLRLWTYAVPR